MAGNFPHLLKPALTNSNIPWPSSYLISLPQFMKEVCASCDVSPEIRAQLGNREGMNKNERKPSGPPEPLFYCLGADVRAKSSGPTVLYLSISGRTGKHISGGRPLNPTFWELSLDSRRFSLNTERINS